MFKRNAKGKVDFKRAEGEGVGTLASGRVDTGDP